MRTSDLRAARRAPLRATECALRAARPRHPVARALALVGLALGALSCSRLVARDPLVATPLDAEGALATHGQGSGGPAVDGDEVRFDRRRHPTVHNAYEQREGLREQLDRRGVRSLELDLHAGKTGRRAPRGEWLVYHRDFPGLDGTSCRTLSECLAHVEAFHRATPMHEVITLFLDMKDGFGDAAHRPDALDDRLRASLDAAALWGPTQALARCPGAATLRDAVTGACGWPTMGELRGRVVVVLTGAGLCQRRSRLDDYVAGGADAHRRAAFVAPNLDGSCTFSPHADAAPHAVFFNLDVQSLAQARHVAAAGLVGRAYHGGLTGGLDDAPTWRFAARSGAQFLATDRLDPARYPWLVD